MTYKLMALIVARGAAMLSLSLVACTWGMTPARLPAANGPQGVQVAVRVRGESADRVGELIAVDSIGMMVRGIELQRVAWSRVHAVDVAGFGVPYDVAPGRAVDMPARSRLALLSRYPQGLDEALLARVLSALGQAALVEVGIPPGNSEVER
jgi:hypothetical protein